MFNGKINYREKFEVWFINLLALLQKEGKGFFSPGVGGGGRDKDIPGSPNTDFSILAYSRLSDRKARRKEI